MGKCQPKDSKWNYQLGVCFCCCSRFCLDREKRGERRAEGLLWPMVASGGANIVPARLPLCPFQSCTSLLSCVPSPLVVTVWEVARGCLSRGREGDWVAAVLECSEGELWVTRGKEGNHEDEEQDHPVLQELKRMCRGRQTVRRVRNLFSYLQPFRNATASRLCSPVSFFRLCLL